MDAIISDEMIFVYITGENKIPGFISEHSRNIYFVWDKGRDVKAIFQSPACCDTFHIYNKQGELMHKAILYDNPKEEVRPFLREVIDEGPIRYFDNAYKQTKIEKIGLLDLLSHYVRQQEIRPAHFFVGLISNICIECPSSAIINRINNIYKMYPASLCSLVFLSRDFNNTDIINLQASIKVEMPVLVVPNGIGEIWEEIRTKLPPLFDNIFLLFTSEGNLIAYLDERKPDDFIKTICSSLEK